MSEIRRSLNGQVRQINRDADKSRQISFVISTPIRDRHGTVLNQYAWHLDNYRKNPIVVYQHNVSGDLITPADPDNIIAKTVSLGVESVNGIRCLTAVAEFEPEDINPKAEKIFRKILFGSMGATSVGFHEIGNGRYGSGDEAKGGANETYYFSGQELVEWSLVSIPSNPDAGKRTLLENMKENQGDAVMRYAVRYLQGTFTLDHFQNMSLSAALALIEAKENGMSDDQLKSLFVSRRIEDVKDRERQGRINKILRGY
jgi:hypothetical protein